MGLAYVMDPCEKTTLFAVYLATLRLFILTYRREHPQMRSVWYLSFYEYHSLFVGPS